MDVRTCKECRRIFNYLTGPVICPSCKDKLEEKFQEVKKYVEEHPGVNMHQVAEECDVEVQQIRQWLKEERLELTEGSANFLTCESCGCAIRSGRYCDKCRNNLANNFQTIIKQSKPAPAAAPAKKDKENPKMRFL
ncbi:MAG: flagellar protein [Clostridium sp.]|nr:flagellar protein [Acetatifactor muris]MCM1526758.1 flagellar protein [Bacteroides sp.]MCM1562782.1 flagellar protein [Clostridium sp.]